MSQETLVPLKEELFVGCISFYILDPFIGISGSIWTPRVFVEPQGIKLRTYLRIHKDCIGQWQFTAAINPHFLSSILLRQLVHMLTFKIHFNFPHGPLASWFCFHGPVTCRLKKLNLHLKKLCHCYPFLQLSNSFPPSPHTSGVTKAHLFQCQEDCSYFSEVLYPPSDILHGDFRAITCSYYSVHTHFLQAGCAGTHKSPELCSA